MRGASVLMLLLLLALAAARAASRRPSQERAAHVRVRSGEWVHAQRRDHLIVRTICEAACWRHARANQCMKACLVKQRDKPGACPQLIQINDNSNTTALSPTPFYVPCLDECREDADCAGVHKCCVHHCGSTCQQAIHSDNNSDLLPVPSDIHVKARRRKALHIKWKPSTSPAAQATFKGKRPTFYILEQRQQLGTFDSDRLDMGKWSTCLRTGKTSVLLRNFVRPGRWYQFRIASVNENGTRGFSPPTTYIAQIGPRPPKIPEVFVGPVYSQENALHVRLQWSQPNSEAPIVKFKVFWSKRLFGTSDLDSVLVLQHSLPADINNYTIHDLDANSMYFIQVQAVAQFDKEILRGEKSGYVLNTTDYIQNPAQNKSNTQNTTISKIDSLQLEKLYWSKDENDLKARFTWKASFANIRYNITWWGSCKHNKTPQHKLTATTRNSHFDVYDLHFDCRYKVNVKETHHTRRRRTRGQGHPRVFYETSVTFTTPSCTSLQMRYKRLKCNVRK